MSRKNRKGASAGRMVLGLSVLAGWSAGTVLMARLGGPVAAAVAGPLFTVPLCSLGEWFVHGILYHGHIPGLEFIRTIHHQGHHFALFPPERYVQSGKYEFMQFRKPLLPFRMSDNPVDNFLTKWSQIALHFVTGVPLIMVPAWLLTHSVAFTVSSLVTLTFISWVLAWVHGVIHTPRDRWVEHQGWFQWLDRHHYIHHIDLQANMNFGLPLCDYLFGTKKWELTEKEIARNPSFEQAKPMAKDIPQATTAPAE